MGPQGCFGKYSLRSTVVDVSTQGLDSGPGPELSSGLNQELDTGFSRNTSSCLDSTNARDVDQNLDQDLNMEQDTHTDQPQQQYQQTQQQQELNQMQSDEITLSVHQHPPGPRHSPRTKPRSDTLLPSISGLPGSAERSAQITDEARASAAENVQPPSKIHENLGNKN